MLGEDRIDVVDLRFLLASRRDFPPAQPLEDTILMRMPQETHQ